MRNGESYLCIFPKVALRELLDILNKSSGKWNIRYRIENTKWRNDYTSLSRDQE